MKSRQMNRCGPQLGYARDKLGFVDEHGIRYRSVQPAFQPQCSQCGSFR
jgi:hypothetical protein